MNSMTTDEKLAIIKGWTHHFRIETGGLSCTAILYTNADYSRTIKIVGSTEEDLIHKTYEQFRAYIWTVTRQVECTKKYMEFI